MRQAVRWALDANLGAANYPNDGYWEPTLRRKFVWYNWLLVEELDALNGNAIVRRYTWGLDLAGQNGSAVGPVSNRSGLESGGGIGGLLALQDPDDDGDPNDPNDIERNYAYFYDANGNVGQLVDWENSGNLVAKYEYDPYGRELAATGDYAADNPFRFSTKYWDDETDLGYWGYRYYSPRLGRWLNPDPLAERGGANLHAYADDNPTNTGDPVGLCKQSHRFVYGNKWWTGGPTSLAGEYFLHYLLNHLFFSDVLVLYLGAADAAEIMENSPSIKAAIDNVLQQEMNTRGKNLECDCPHSWVHERFTRRIRGYATTVGAWTDVLGTFSYDAVADCVATKRCWCCDDGDRAWRIDVGCFFEFQMLDYYDFWPWWRSTMESLIFDTFVIQWQWSTHGDMIMRCDCRDGTRNPGGGAGGTW